MKNTKYYLQNTVSELYVLHPKKLVACLNDASKFKTIESARKAYKDSKDFWTGSFVIVSNEGKFYDVDTGKALNKTPAVPGPRKKDPNKEELQKAELAARDLSENIEQLSEWLNAILTNSEHIGDAHTNIEKEVVDIYHTIELSTFNACEGYKLAKRLQETLQRRRLIKDSEAMLPLLTETSKNLKKAVSNKSKRTYTYRVIKDLEIREPKTKAKTKKSKKEAAED